MNALDEKFLRIDENNNNRKVDIMKKLFKGTTWWENTYSSGIEAFKRSRQTWELWKTLTGEWFQYTKNDIKKQDGLMQTRWE